MIEASEATSQSFCTITNSTFTHNTASSAGLQWINPCGSARGGGISVVPPDTLLAPLRAFQVDTAALHIVE